MNLLRRLSRTFCLLAFCLYCAACGGASSSGLPDDPASLAPPPGVDSALWETMQAELQRVRTEHGRDRGVSMAPKDLNNRVSQIGTEDSGDGGVNVGWYYRNIGDYDLNGQVTISDLTPVGVGFQATSASPAWFGKGVADGDANGEVNLADITPIGVHFGNGVTGYIVEHTTTPQFLGSYVPVAEILLSEGSVLQSKVTSGITLPTEIRQIYFQVKIDALSAGDAYGIRPYFEMNGVRELGIASYETKPPGESAGWPMSGGDTTHSGLSDTYFSTHAQLLYNTGSFVTAWSCLPEYDDGGDYYLGSADGRLFRFAANGAEIWQRNLGWRINALKFIGGEFGMMVLHDGGVSFFDAGGTLVTAQALGRVRHAPVTLSDSGGERREAGISGDGLLWELLLKDSAGVSLAWQHDFAGPARGNAVSSGQRIFAVIEGLNGADDMLVSTDLDGLDPQTNDSAAAFDAHLQSAADGRIWLNVDGNSLQAYEADGTAGAFITPSAGQFGGFIADNDDNSLWISRVDGSSWSILHWDAGLDSLIKEQSVPAAVLSLLDGGSGLAALLDDGTLRSYDAELGEDWSTALQIAAQAAAAPSLIRNGSRIDVLSTPVWSSLDAAGGSLVSESGDSLNEARLNIALQAGNVQFLSHVQNEQAGQLHFDGSGGFELGGPLERPGVVAISSALTVIPLSPTEVRRRICVTFRTDTPAFQATRLTDSLRGSSAAAADYGIAMYEADGSRAWEEYYDGEELGAPSYSFRRVLLNARNLSTGDGRVLCLTEAGGSELWNVVLDSPGATVPVADDNADCYVVTESGRVHKISEKGQDIWNKNHPVPTTGLVLYQDLLFYGTADSLVAINADDGSLAFEENLADGLDATPAVGSTGFLQFVTTQGDFMQIDVSGADHTPQLLYDGSGRAAAQPICDGSGLTAWLTTDGIVHCADGGGNLLWEIDTYSTARAELSVDLDGNIYAVDEWGRIAVIGQ